MKGSHLYLVHMVEALEKIEIFTEGGKDVFLSDILIQDAVYRNFEVIGEAAKRVPDDIRSLITDVPWRQVSGLRDALIHQYDGIDPVEVWRVVEGNVSDIKASIQIYLDSLK